MVKLMLNSLLEAILILTSFIFLSVFAPQVHKTALRSYVSSKVVKLTRTDTSRAGGTGFHVKLPSGKTGIITNKHVCGLSKNGYMVAESEEFSSQVKILKISDETDLCLLQPLNGVEGLTLARSVAEGETIAAIGHPNLNPRTMTMGEAVAQSIIYMPLYNITNDMDQVMCQTVKNQSLYQIEYPQPDNTIGVTWICIASFNAILTTVTAHPGSSGSPIVNFFGNVVGVVFSVEVKSSWANAIIIKDIKKFIKGQ
jgi:S1-C subfamily serine protease